MRSLEQGPTPAVRARLRRLRLLTLGCLVVVTVVGLLIPLLLLPDRPDRSASDDPATALDVAGVIVMGVAVLVEGIALVLMARAFRGRWYSPLTPLTRLQNKQLLAMVRGTEHAEDVRVPLARYLAESMLRQRPVVLVLCGVALLWTGMVLMQPSVWRLGMLVACVVLVGYGVWSTRRNEGRARRFLAEHPATGA
jgi:hypothetical protein